VWGSSGTTAPVHSFFLSGFCISFGSLEPLDILALFERANPGRDADSDSATCRARSPPPTEFQCSYKCELRGTLAIGKYKLPTERRDAKSKTRRSKKLAETVPRSGGRGATCKQLELTTRS
jgi:hypothetical protein